MERILEHASSRMTKGVRHIAITTRECILHEGHDMQKSIGPREGSRCLGLTFDLLRCADNEGGRFVDDLCRGTRRLQLQKGHRGLSPATVSEQRHWRDAMGFAKEHARREVLL